MHMHKSFNFLFSGEEMEGKPLWCLVLGYGEFGSSAFTLTAYWLVFCPELKMLLRQQTRVSTLLK